MFMRDLSEIRFRPPRSVAEGARWIGLTIACLVITYFVVTLFLLLTGVWGVGTIVIHGLRVRLLSPWNEVAAILVGIQALSLTSSSLRWRGGRPFRC